MRTISAKDDAVTLELTGAELLVAANALNEVLHGPEAVEDWEFHPRLGVERDEGRRLHQAFLSVLRP